LRRRLQRGEFWLVPADEFNRPGNAQSVRDSMLDLGRQVVLADNYRNKVKPGAAFFMRSTPAFTEEFRRELHGTWRLISDEVRQGLLEEYDLDTESGDGREEPTTLASDESDDGREEPVTLAIDESDNELID